MARVENRPRPCEAVRDIGPLSFLDVNVGSLSEAGRKALALYDATASLPLRGERGEFFQFATRTAADDFAICTIVNGACTLTTRVEDAWRLLGLTGKSYAVSVVSDGGERSFDCVAPDARFFIDYADFGGSVVSLCGMH